MRFQFRYNPELTNFSFIIIDENGECIPFNAWHEHQSLLLPQLSIVDEFIANGFAHQNNDSVEIDVEDIYKLAEVEQQLLGLPEFYPYTIYIEPVGMLHETTLNFSIGYYDFMPHGNGMQFNRNGPLLNSDESHYLLTLNQFLVIDTIEKFNELPELERSFTSNLHQFSDIKNLSRDGAVLLDQYLQDENVVNPDKIKIDPSFQDCNFELKPKVDGIESEAMVRAFDLPRNVKSVYNVIDLDGNSTRVIINSEQKEALESLKQYRQIEDDNIVEDIVENPENYFDDNVVDLAWFSERVREIGLYKPKFYPFICPYKSEWIPGYVIRDKLNGEKKVRFTSTEELQPFEQLFDEARQNNESEFLYKGEPISTNAAKSIIETAKEQFQKPNKPIVPATQKNEQEVLIIKENANELEYIENHVVPEELTYNFHIINNLNPVFQLKNHQENGVAWMQSLFADNISGCLLADDMGLGKTLQLLYFIEWHAISCNGNKPYLIVAPVSILENWENEYQKFFDPPKMELINLHGAPWLEKRFSENIVEKLQKKQILLINYESLRSYQLNFCAVDFAVVALDEAQKIKTPGTLITNVSKALKADFKIAMTGTPVENTLMDLWCIMDFCIPGLLGNAKDFAKTYLTPLKDEKTDVNELCEIVRKKIDCFLLRRLKNDVANDLPSKEEMRIQRDMPPKQIERYINEIELAKESNSIEGQNGNQYLKSLWTIRDISDHPFLSDSQIDKFSTDELIISSAKLQILVDKLREVQRRSEKMIVFADRRKTQAMLQKVIYEVFMVYPSIINGDTPSSRKKATGIRLSRQQTINRFEDVNGFNVIIMSPIAAGVGLNVTGANHVFHYSRHWNPAKEDQATDRAYRIGQHKDVMVYYPMAVFPENMRDVNGDRLKSFDQILEELLSRKKNLASSTLYPTDQIELKPQDIIGDTFGLESDTVGTKLTIDDLDKLNPLSFEACIAALYTEMEFDTTLTPNTNDKGADVVALGDNVNYLIQAKQSQNNIDNSAVQEIVTAKRYYENRFNVSFELMVVSNSLFSAGAIQLAEENEVILIHRDNLEKLVEENDLTIKKVKMHDAHRLLKI